MLAVVMSQGRGSGPHCQLPWNHRGARSSIQGAARGGRGQVTRGGCWGDLSIMPSLVEVIPGDVVSLFNAHRKRKKEEGKT